jgi:hypothetical protein
MVTKKKGYAQAAKETLKAVAGGSPGLPEAESVQVSKPNPDNEMTGPQPTVEGPPAQPTERPNHQGLVPVSNTFDTAAPSKERLHELEGRFRKKMTAACETAAEAIVDILTIRDERQYEAEGYATFDAYMKDRWDYTRQWVEQMEKHLKMVRIMQEKLGFGPDEASKKLTLYDAGILRPLQDDPDVFVAAIKEAEEQYKTTGKKSPKTLKAVVEKWDGFRQLDKKLRPEETDTPPEQRPQPLTPEEFSLVAQLKRDKHDKRCPGLVGQAKQKAETENIPLVLALDKVCEEAGNVPPDEELLSEVRGDALKELIAPLAAHVKGWKAAAKLKESEAQKEAQEAEAELDRVRQQMAKTPQQKEQERLAQEEERRKQEEREAEAERLRQQAQERQRRHQEIWGWHEDELSLACETDPRKWCEDNNGEDLPSDVLTRIAADCLADAVKRISEMREAEKPIAIKAARKAMQWGDKLREALGD